MKKGKVLVVGGAGYIGSHACLLLACRGYEPIVFDSLITGHKELVRWGPLMEGDLGDRAALDALFREHHFDAVIHFAAFSTVGESVADPGRYYTNNVAKTLCLLDAMRHHGVEKIVFSSTCAVYGNPIMSRITEDHPQSPVNPYGRSKLMVETILKDYASAYGLKSVVLRYFNAVGADPDGQTGEMHQPETHLIPLAIDASKEGGKGLTVFGTDYDTPDGTCIRDYIHVMDLADAHEKALSYMDQAMEKWSAFNLGTETGMSVLDIIRAIEGISGGKVNWTKGPRREGDPAVLIADSQKARSDLSWAPAYSDMHTIIKTAYQWQRKM